MSQHKAELRERLRRLRREHVAALPAAARGLLFHRPPQPLVATIAPGAVVGAYAEGQWEAPAGRYARWFFEAGHPVALPWFAARGAPMRFRAWNPFAPEPLVRGPYGVRQPEDSARELAPEVILVPVLGFTADGARLGQGAGHYDRWLAANPATRAIGLAWDCQLLEALPAEPHDRALDAVVTPTRVYGDLAR